MLHSTVDYTSDIGSTAESLVSWSIKWTVGSALGEIGALVFVGAELASWIGTGSLVPGARIVEGVLWMAGPANTLVALAAEGVASLGSRQRELRPDEYDWANEMVFSGCLPPREQLILTDSQGGGRPAIHLSPVRRQDHRCRLCDPGLEAQAQVISDWFAGTNTHGATGQTKPRDVNSPYFGDVQAMRNGHFF